MNCKSVYNDDELKNNVLNILNETDDLYHELKNYNVYDYHYCLNYLRENLFLWYPFKSEGSLLEIGAGCGQLTNLFCERLDKVVSVENDNKLIEIINKRCTSDNLTVLENDFSDIKSDEKFDYIVLCDIFEYAKHFFESKTPYISYLSYLRGFLKDDGVILIAISNRMGLKYFAGFREEHVDSYFAGIDDFPDADFVQTFSKSEFEDLIQLSGFTNYKFFYPFPDHRFPNVINTDEFINKIPYSRLPVYVDRRAQLFREHKLNQTLANDNISQYFSNSFLVEIRNDDSKRKTDDLRFLKLSSNRDKKFRTITSIHGDEEFSVTKSPISSDSVGHLKNMHEATEYDFGKIKFLDNSFDGENFTYPFIVIDNLEQYLIDAITSNDRGEFYRLLEYFFDALFHNSYITKNYATEEFLNVFRKRSDIAFHCHDITNLDVIFSNLFIIDDELVTIDYEWFFKFPIPLEYIFYRVIRHHNVTNPLFRDFASIEEIFEHFDLDVENMKLFRRWELNFAKYVYTDLIRPKVNRVPEESVDKLDDVELMGKQLECMKTSKSWKITKPLRKVISTIKRR